MTSVVNSPPRVLKLVGPDFELSPRIGIADRAVIFAHVPKTGGTTLGQIMKAVAAARGEVFQRVHYAPFAREGKSAWPTLEALPDDVRRTCSYLTGHIPYGAHAALVRSSLYVTILREPVARLRSHLRFAAKRGAIGRDATVDELFRSGWLIDNPQTRQIAGMAARDEPCTAKSLDVAVANLRDRFAVVGVTERFDETLKALITAFGWPSIAYSDMQTTRGVSVPELEAQAAAAIERHCQHDLALYKFAAALRQPWSETLLGRNGVRRQGQDEILVAAPSAGRAYALMDSASFERTVAPAWSSRGGMIERL